MNHQSEPKAIVARKPHSCHWCSERIDKGTKYESTFIVWEGDPWTRKLHPECAAAERAYDYDGDTLYYEGQFQRGHVHEPNWGSVADGVSFKCPGCIAMANAPSTGEAASLPNSVLGRPGRPNTETGCDRPQGEVEP